MSRWQIGDVRITKIVELEIPGSGTFVLPDAEPQNVIPIPWLVPHFATANGELVMSVHALVVESRGRRIVVDTCVGNDKERPVPDWNLRQGPFLEDLAEAGFPRETIDTVLCTHLHVDHVGWNTMKVGDRWLPTFPNARYLLGETEWAYWDKEPEDMFGSVMGDSVRPVLEACLADLVQTDHEITDEVRLESTPGHTPGHVSVHITSRGEEAVITGDLMHHPCQMARPEWASSFDYDAEQARATRVAFLQRYADTPVLIIGTHFAGPTAGHIVRDGGAYRLDV